MPYTINHEPALGILEVKFYGAITAPILRESNAECIAMQKRTGATGFLVDADGWELTAPMVDVYELPAKFYQQENLDRRTRIAILQPKTERSGQAANFFLDVCHNRGWHARIFADRAAAMEWLSKREAAPT